MTSSQTNRQLTDNTIHFSRQKLLKAFGLGVLAVAAPARITPGPGGKRRHDMDWLRTIAVWLLVAFHPAVIFTVILITPLILDLLPGGGYNPASMLVTGVYGGFGMWVWLLTFLGCARHNLNFDHAILRRFTLLPLPFYILCQVVLISIGYYVLRTGVTLYPAFFIIVTLTFAVTWLLADFGIRPWKFTQLCFGMKG